MGGASIQIVHYFDHVYLGEERSMIHSFPVTFEAKYLTCMVTSVPSYETFSLIKNNILHQSKNYKNHFENSNFWGDTWHTVSFIWCSYEQGFLSIILLITQYLEWSDDKLYPQILSLGTTSNATLINEDVSWWSG